MPKGTRPTMDNTLRNKIRAVLAGTIWVLMVTATAQASQTSGSQRAFAPGERLTFVLKWTIIPAGEAVLETMPIDHVAGRDAYHFSLTATSNAFVDVFFKVRDRIHAWTDTGLQQSLLYRKKQHEGNRRRDVTVFFDWEKMTAQYTDRHGNRNQAAPPIEIGPGTFDPLSAFYWTRSADLFIGQRIQRPVTDGKKQVTGIARVIERETVTVPAGTFDTYLIEPDLSHVGGVFEKSPNAKIQLWVTTDPRHLPIKLASEVVVGSFTGELVEMTGTRQSKSQGEKKMNDDHAWLWEKTAGQCIKNLEKTWL